MLFKLSEANGASGYEKNVSDIIISEAKKYADTIVKDLIMKNNNYLDSSEM